MILGLVSGLWLVLGGYHVLDLAPTGGSPPPESSFYPRWFFYIISPLVGVLTGVSLLIRSMTLERRGIVGFIAFVSSLPTIPLILFYLVA